MKKPLVTTCGSYVCGWPLATSPPLFVIVPLLPTYRSCLLPCLLFGPTYYRFPTQHTTYQPFGTFCATMLYCLPPAFSMPATLLYTHILYIVHVRLHSHHPMDGRLAQFIVHIFSEHSAVLCLLFGSACRSFLPYGIYVWRLVLPAGYLPVPVG